MKTTILLLALVICLTTSAQHELVSNAALIYVDNGATLKVMGSFTNQPGSYFTNHGIVTISGNITNNQVMATYSGKLVFNNSTAQTLSGATPFLTRDVEINNTAGVTLNTILKVDGACTFINGMINTDAVTPLLFTSTGSVTGVSDASHVNGYVVKEGTGNFSYPVGDGTRYQAVDVNASVNPDGIKVNYTTGNAGSGSFTGPAPLLYYNTLEYWNIAPLSTATGSVTIYWDDYNNTGIGNTANLRVAHYTGGVWVNENATATAGTVSAGSVTSYSVNDWSPFTLGSMSISSTLPVSWLAVTGMLNTQQQAVISWKVTEQQVAYYQVEKSEDARDFTSIGLLYSKGNGDNNYVYSDREIIKNISYYRVKQTDRDGKFSYSPVIKLYMQPGSRLSVYPVPFKESFTVISPVAQTARLTTADGKLIRLFQLKAGTNYVNTGLLSKGVYLLVTPNMAVHKIVKD